mgnify:CR=1 FL=1
MADATAVKKATALAADTSVDSNDMFLVADAGTAELKRLSWARVLAKIKSELITADLKTVTNSGLSTAIYESEVAIRIRISGTTTGVLATSAGYISLGTIKHTSLRSVLKKVIPRTGWVATFRVNAESGKVELGYTVQNGSATNVPSGTTITIDETIMIV